MIKTRNIVNFAACLLILYSFLSKISYLNHLLKVGITGGIGSGKTTICRIFETIGIPVYYADDRAKWLMVNNLSIVNELKKLFGEATYLPNGTLNRAHLASIVFNNKEQLKALENIVHPAVRTDGLAWHLAQKNVPYTLKEAALHFEGGGYKEMDKMITIFAPKEVRIERVLSRDNTTREAIEARMDNQMSDEEKMKRADFVIYNDGQQSIIRQVLKVHRALCAIANQ